MWRVLLRRPIRCQLPTPNNRPDLPTRQIFRAASTIVANTNALSAERAPEGIKSQIAINAREAATVIVTRCTEKNINSVLKSFECAKKRPRRQIIITTRNGIDVSWMNDWFQMLQGNTTVPLYPIEITATTGFEAAKEALCKALINVNKFDNILADDKDIYSEGESQNEKAIIEFCSKECPGVPVGVSMALADVIKRYNSEEFNLSVFRRRLKSAAGIHSQILPGIFQILGFKSNGVSIPHHLFLTAVRHFDTTSRFSLNMRSCCLTLP